MIRHTSLFVLLLFVSLAVKAAWNGAVASAYAGGDGSKANPYLISNADQLAKLGTEKSSLKSGLYIMGGKKVVVK